MSQLVSESKEVPPRLRPGDTVAIVAPASPVPADQVRAGLDRLGERYHLRVADDLYRSDPAAGYLAGSDERRADELNQCFRDPDVRAVVLARGGYGILRLLDRLDAAALRADPKPIVGFSDATALLSWADRIAGVRGVHGPVVKQMRRLPPEQITWLFDLLEGRADLAAPVAAGLSPVGAARTGRIEGPLRGGNLTLLSHLVGTPWAVEPAGAIMLIEDVTERPYALDRYLTHLTLAGALRGAAGALVGDFTDIRPDDLGLSGQVSPGDVVSERLAAAGVAGLAGAPIGHGARNLAVPFGARAALDVDAGELWLLEPAVG